MHAIRVKELKNRLARYLALIREGRRVVVADRGAPVAVLGPVEEHDRRKASKAHRAAVLARRGLITLPGDCGPHDATGLCSGRADFSNLDPRRWKGGEAMAAAVMNPEKPGAVQV